jgi:hypothetical protein
VKGEGGGGGNYDQSTCIYGNRIMKTIKIG